MTTSGYGKILDVNLSTGQVTRKDVEPEFARQYLGGVGFSCRMLYDEVGPDVEPFSTEDIIIFANGPLTGTHAPTGGRTEITTKHPLTGGIGTGNTGGLWGAGLKRAGFDLVVVRGAAEKPVFLSINDESVEIKDARDLWGKETRTTSDILRERLSPQTSVLAIGPAGENLVRYACPLNDYYHVAGRSGAGAVMGSKKLKAIAVRGTGVPEAARPADFRQAARDAREHLVVADKAWWNSEGEQIGEPGRRGGALSMENARKYFTKKGAICYACPMNCYNMMGEVKEGKYAGLKESNVDRTMVVGIFGRSLGIDNFPAIWKCKERSQELGMDYAVLGPVLAFATDLFRRNIITKAETDGLELTSGNEDAVLEMMRKIAFREGFGDVLAEGSARAAKIIGRGAEKHVKTMKGMDVNGGPPSENGRKGWLIGGLTSPRGDITKSTHFMMDVHNPSWWTDKFDMPEKVKQQIYKVSPEELFSTWEGKAMMLKWSEDLHCVVEPLGLCFFASHMRLALGPTHLARLFSTFTGLEISPEEIMTAGERIFTLFKAHNFRQGMTRKDDNWPARSYEEAMNDGVAVIPRETIERFLDEYYELRGWDQTTGLPAPKKFAELGLADIADDLARRGLTGLPHATNGPSVVG